jgi:hypothetical protein
MRSETKFQQTLVPLMMQQMKYIVQWPAFHISTEIVEKLKTISPASAKKDKDTINLKGKRLTKPLDSLKSRIPDFLPQ